MKVKFDLKYRQQIESGEYKVETADGRQVRIICWDAHNPYRENDIVALATSSSSESENILRYYSNGHLISDSANIGNKDLIVVIPDEDERIRKQCIKLIREAYSTNYEAFECIAWLEKQQEQKSDGRGKATINGEPIPTENHSVNIPLAVWSEDDAQKIGTLSSIIYDYAFHKDALDENNDLTGEYAELDKWLEYLPERFNLQPKEEWSEDKYPKNIENAATMFCFDNGLNITPHQAVMIAKHFYELGFKRMSNGRA